MDELKKLLENAGIAEAVQPDMKTASVFQEAYDLIYKLASQANISKREYERDIMPTLRRIAELEEQYDDDGYEDPTGQRNADERYGPINEEALDIHEVAQEIAASVWNWTVTKHGYYDSHFSEVLLEMVDKHLLEMQREYIKRDLGK